MSGRIAGKKRAPSVEEEGEKRARTEGVVAKASLRDVPTLVPSDGLSYQAGFGNHFATEALEGALPVGQNSPQKVRATRGRGRGGGGAGRAGRKAQGVIAI
jgi:homogentisate 1,2-dioxygenase